MSALPRSEFRNEESVFFYFEKMIGTGKLVFPHYGEFDRITKLLI